MTPLLLVTLVCAAVAWRARHERVLMFWLIWSGAVHVLMDANYGVHASLVTTPATTTFAELVFSRVPVSSFFDMSWWAKTFYSQYARYDGRWAMSDPVVLFICYSEWFMGAVCFALAWLTHKQHPMRHAFHLMLATAQVFGTFFYFLVPVIDGTWSKVMTHNTFELWMYVYVLNGIWIVVPGIIIVVSLRAMAREQRAAALREQRATA